MTSLRSWRWTVIGLGSDTCRMTVSFTWGWVEVVGMEWPHLYGKGHPDWTFTLSFPAKRSHSSAAGCLVPVVTGTPTWCFTIGLNLSSNSLFFFLCCRLASSELNIKKILRGETARPADCFFPKWMRWWTNTFIYINNQLKGPSWMWAFVFDDTLIVTINNNIFIVG